MAQIAFFSDDPQGVRLDTTAVTFSQAGLPSLAALNRMRYFGDYELLGEIAHGGMGAVLKARQISLKRIVALKIPFFNSSTSRDVVQRFRTEAEAVAMLDHPNIVPVYETGQHEGLYYISMKLIDGRTLAEELKGQPLAARRSAGLVCRIARAVHYAHQRGILHRDLKPGNILLDANGEPHVTDFGLAKLTESETHVTQTNTVMGSPAYMSPEQARGQTKSVTTAADVYSLGAIFYELLTGRPPFSGQSAIDVVQQVVGREVISPSLIQPHVDRDLETICVKCLEKEPERRYGSAEALADDLDRWLRHEPILARPSRAWERALKWGKRKPAIAGLTLAVVFVAISGFTGVLWQWRKAESARRTAVDKAVAEANARRELHALNYVSDMNLALRSYSEGNPARAFELLRRYAKPKDAEPDLRGFEWRHLWWLCRGNYSATLPTHKSVVGALAFSPNGRVVATYSWNDTVRLWDLQTRENFYSLTNAASLGCFSKDGETFIVGGQDGSIRFCQTETGKVLRTIPNLGEVVAFDSNGTIAVTISQKGLLTVWNLSTRQATRSIPGATQRRSDHGYSAKVAISPNGQVLAVVESSKGPHQPDLGIRLWMVETGKEIQTLRENREIRCLLFSPDGKTLAAGCGDGAVILRRLVSDQNQSLVLPGSSGLPVLALAFSPDGRTLATGGSDQAIRLWDSTSGSPIPESFQGQIGDVWSLAFSPDGRQLASGSRDTTIKIWNAAHERINETPFHDLLPEHWGNFTFSPDSRLMAAGCKKNVVRVWDVRTLRVVAELPGASYAVAFSQDGHNLLSASADEMPQWWNLEARSAKPIPRYNGSVNSRVASFDLSPDRRTAALGHYDGGIELLEIDSGKSTTWRGHDPNAVLSVAFSRLGDKLVTGSREHSIKMWDVRTQKALGSSEEHRGGVCAVAFSHDGTMIASGCGAGTLKFWKTESALTRSLGSFSSHESTIRSLAFAPDGKSLASGSEDNSVKLWNVPTEKEVATFKHDGHIRMVVFSPDGNNLAIVTDSGTLELLRAATLADADTSPE